MATKVMSFRLDQHLVEEAERLGVDASSVAREAVEHAIYAAKVKAALTWFKGHRFRIQSGEPSEDVVRRMRDER